MVTLIDLEALHLEAEIALTDQATGASVHISDQTGVKLNLEIAGCLYLVIESLHGLQDGLIVVDMLHQLYEVADVKLLVKLEVQDLGLMLQLNRNVNVVVQDILEDLVDSEELHGGHGILKVAFIPGNDISASVASAD